MRALLPLPLLISLAFAQEGAEALQQAVAARLEAAKEKAAAKDWDGAIAEYDHALKLDEACAAAWLGRGSAKHSKRDYDGALADYTQAIAVDPAQGLAYFNRGSIRAWQKDHAGAVEDFTAAIELHPNWAAAYVKRGDSRRQLVDYAGAAQDYQQAAELDPKNATAYLNSAAVREDMGDFAGAEAIYTALLRVDPSSAAAYRGRGRARAFQRKRTSEEDFAKAIELAPDEQLNLVVRARMRMLAGLYDEAKEDCAAAIKLAPKDSYPYYTLALVHYNFGNYQQARIECLKAISRATYEPDYLQLYVTLAKLRLKSYDDARAIRELKEYWQGKKEEPDAWTARVVQFVCGELDEEKLLAAAEGDTPKQTRERECEAHFYAGTLREIAGDAEAARSHFEACVATGVSNFIEYESATVYLRRAG